MERGLSHANTNFCAREGLQRTEAMKEHAILRSGVSHRFVAWAPKRMHGVRARALGHRARKRCFRPDEWLHEATPARPKRVFAFVNRREEEIGDADWPTRWHEAGRR